MHNNLITDLMDLPDLVATGLCQVGFGNKLRLPVNILKC